ncbi:MAG: hypothetical protein J6Q18_01350 [Oscillospiraceae bacterium]|nr:hypothetical protein [Oscillospiraceae bacterium]
MVNRLKNISSRAIIIGTALMLTAAFILSGLFAFVSETAARKSGDMYNHTLNASDFTWNGIKTKDGVVITTDNDPQMLLEAPMKFTSLRFYMESSIYPGEMVVYYTEPGDTGFSVQKRLWIVPTDQPNWYVLETPMKTVTALRIDPTMYAGNILEFGEFIFNEEKAFLDYFAVSYGDFFNLIVYTGIISSVLKFLQEMLKKEID